MKSVHFTSHGGNFRRLKLQGLALINLCIIILFTTTYSYSQANGGYNWSNVAMGGGGFVSGIITNKKAGGPIYARTDVGGAYRWDATNSKWIPLTDFANEHQQGAMGTLALAIDPQQQNIVYLMAGISYFNKDTSYIMRSTDYGANFTVTDVTSKFKVNGNAMGRQNGERLQVDPNNSSILYCGTQSNGLFRSNDSGSSWNQSGIGALTTNNGNGLSFVLLDKSSVATVNNVKQTQRIFVGVSRSGSNQNFYRSDNGGASFTAINNTSLMAGVMPQRAVLTSDGAYLYITYGNGAGPSGTTAEPYDQGQIWRYTVATGAWYNVTPLNSGSRVNSAFCGISIDPFNNNRLVASTTNVYKLQANGAYGDRFFYSTDGGSNWTDVIARGFSLDPNGVPWFTNASIHWAGSIEFDPSNTNRIMVTSGNGTFVNEDITQTAGVWKVNVKGLEETVPLNMVSIPGGPVVSVIYDYDGFTQNDPTQYPANRHIPSMGTTGGLAASLTNKTVVRVASSMYYSTDNGFNWTKTNALPGVDGEVAVAANGSAILHCPKGSGTIYRSFDKGSTWYNTNINVTDARPVADGSNSNKFYVYDGNNGKLLVSTNSGANFNATAATLATGGSKIIRSVPGFEGNLWIALYGGGLVYTQDSGTTFTTVANVTFCGAVGIGKAHACVAYPTIYIWGSISGSANGLYRSVDMGQNWVRVNDDNHQYGGLANGQFVVGDMNNYGNVYMSTAGRGIAMGSIIPALDVTPSTLTFSSANSSQTAKVSSALYWDVVANQSWTTVTPANGCPNTTFTVTCSANNGATRTGTISIYAGNQVRTVQVNQNGNCTPTAITPYIQVNGGAWTQTATATLGVGGSVSLGPQPNNTTGWNWTGPNGYTSNVRQLDFVNMQSNQAGDYIATYTNSGGCKDSKTFTITVTGGTSMASSFASKVSDLMVNVPNPTIVDKNNANIVVYPNPVDKIVSLKLPSEMIGGKITMVNSNGFILHKGNVTTIDYVIDMSSLPTGLYFINISNNAKSLSAKVLKN